MDSAKVEVDFMKLKGGEQKGTGFITEERQIEAPAEPEPKCLNGGKH